MKQVKKHFVQNKGNAIMSETHSSKNDEVQELAISIRDFMHEFNNNLFLISAKAQLLVESIDNQSVKDDMDIIYSKIQQAAQLFKDIHMISRQYHSGISANCLDTLPVQLKNPDQDLENRVRKVLIAGSDFSTVDKLTELLEGDGNIVMTCEDFTDLLKRIWTSKIQLVLMDEYLPGLDFMELFTNLRRLPEEMSPDIIVMTEDSEKVFPGVTTVTKPMSSETIRLLMNR